MNSTWIVFLCLLIFSFSHHAKSAEPVNSSTVTLSLSEYLTLKAAQEKEGVTSVESVILSGDFETSNLRLSIKGKSSGKFPAVSFLSDINFRMRSCQGPGLIKQQGNQLFLHPQSTSFELTCSLQPSKDGTVNFRTNEVLYTQNEAANSDTMTDESGTLFQAVRRLKSSAVANAAVVSEGRYLISVDPSSRNYNYNFIFSNPNRNKKNFTLELKNGESIESIQTNIDYKEQGKQIEFSLNPGQNLVEVRGKLSTDQFIAPMESGQQFVVIENHPLLQVIPETQWRRVSVEQAQIANQFTSAKAYMVADANPMTWKVNKLEVFSSQGFSVNSSNHRVYFPLDSEPLIETRLSILNQGMPEIPINIPGTLLYLEIDQQVQPLYKDKDGRLVLSLKNGQHEALIQYRAEKSPGLLAFAKSIELIKPNSVVTSSVVSAQLDPSWMLVLGKMSTNLKSVFTTDHFVWLLIGALAVFLLFRFLNLPWRQNQILCFSLVGIFFFKPTFVPYFLFFILLGYGVSKRAWVLDYMKGSSWKRIFTGVAVIVIAVVFYSFLRGVVNSVARKSEMISSEEYYAPTEQVAAQMDGAGSAAGGSPSFGARGIMEKGKSMMTMNIAGSDTGENQFQGLPAKVQFPNTTPQFRMTRTLMNEKDSLRLFVFLFRESIYGYLSLLVGILFCWSVYQSRNKLQAELKRVLAL